MQLRHARDLRRFVADALEVGDGLDHHHHHAQVARRRLAARDDGAAFLVDRDFQRIDAVIVFDHALGERDVAVGQRLEGAHDLLLDQAAHLQHARPHRLEFGVELFQSVFGD